MQITLLMVLLAAAEPSPARLADLSQRVGLELLSEGVSLRRLEVTLGLEPTASGGVDIQLHSFRTGARLAETQLETLPADPTAAAAQVLIVTARLVRTLPPHDESASAEPPPAAEQAPAVTDAPAPAATDGPAPVVTDAPAPPPVAQPAIPPGEAPAPVLPGDLRGPIAVFISSGALEPERVSMLERVLLRKLESVPGLEPFSATTAAATRDACRVDHGCLSAIATALGTRYAVNARVTSLLDNDVLTVRVIDLQRVDVIAADTRTAHPGESLLGAVGPAIDAIFPQATTWSAPPEVAAQWTRQGLPLGVFVGGAVATLASGTLGVVMSILAVTANDSYRAYGSSDQVIDGRQLMELHNTGTLDETIANAAFVGAGVFAVATGLIAYFTDFTGDVDLDAALWPADGGAGASLNGRF